MLNIQSFREYDGSWTEVTPCQDNPALFFPGYSDNYEHDVWPLEAQEEAKRLCKTCPTRSRCLDYAIVNKDEHGIWGARTPDERRRTRLLWSRTFPSLLKEMAPAVDDVVKELCREGSL